VITHLHIYIKVAEVGGLENALKILRSGFEEGILPDLKKSRLHLTRGGKRLALQHAIKRKRARLRKQKEKEGKRKRKYAARQRTCGSLFIGHLIAPCFLFDIGV